MPLRSKSLRRSRSSTSRMSRTLGVVSPVWPHHPTRARRRSSSRATHIHSGRRRPASRSTAISSLSTYGKLQNSCNSSRPEIGRIVRLLHITVKALSNEAPARAGIR
jgi:hypothetical protein